MNAAKYMSLGDSQSILICLTEMMMLTITVTIYLVLTVCCVYL